MTTFVFPNGWYGHGRDDAHVVLIRDSHIETSWQGRIELPDRSLMPAKPQDEQLAPNVLFLDLHPFELRFAGVGHRDDHVWEWIRGTWVRHDVVAFGPRPVMYDRQGVLHVVTGPPANGYRYVAADGHLVTAAETREDLRRHIWEFTDVDAQLTIGQGGAGIYGEDPVIAVVDGVRRLVDRGTCRFQKVIEQAQVTLAYVREHAREAVILRASRADLAAKPVALDLVAPPPPPPPPPSEPIGPRSAPRAADGRVYDLLPYILGDQATWPRKGPSHPMNQVLGPDGRIHFVKFGDPQAYESWRADVNWIEHNEDASNEVYTFADSRWYPRRMAIGYASAFDTGEYLTTYRVRATCQVIKREPSRRRMWVAAMYDRFYWGPDLGERETLVTVYDPTAGIHSADRLLELYYFAKGAGWVRWEAYRSDLVYAHGLPSFVGLTPHDRSDFYLLGGPNTQPKLSGCAPALTTWPPLTPKPVPVPLEDSMIAYGLPVVGFNLGDLIDNGNGTVSVKKPNGRYLCVTPDGALEERDAPGGPWETFTRSATALVAVRGDRVYVLPLVDAGE